MSQRETTSVINVQSIQLGGGVAGGRVARVIRRVDHAIACACLKRQFNAASLLRVQGRGRGGQIEGPPRTSEGLGRRADVVAGVVNLEAPELGCRIAGLSATQGRVRGINHTVGAQLVVGTYTATRTSASIPVDPTQGGTEGGASSWYSSAYRCSPNRRSRRCDRTSSRSNRCCPRAPCRQPRGRAARSGGHRGGTPGPRRQRNSSRQPQ